MTCACGRETSLSAGAWWCPACDDPTRTPIANPIPDAQRWHTWQEKEFIQGLIATGDTTALRGLLQAYAYRWVWQAPGLELDREQCERMIRGALEA